MQPRIVRPDSKGRITLGKKEKWLFENKTALQQIKNGIQDISSNKLSKKGSFSEYA